MKKLMFCHVCGSAQNFTVYSDDFKDRSCNKCGTDYTIFEGQEVIDNG